MTANKSFQPGDVVRMKSGGGRMTIERVEGNEIVCQWVDVDPKTKTRTVQKAVFNPIVLTHVNDDIMSVE